MRLDKFLANNTHYSRREIHILLKAGRIHIDNETATSASQRIHNQQIITLDGQTIYHQDSPLYVMLHKPSGYVSANMDSQNPTVIDLLYERDAFIGSDEGYQRLQQSTLQIVGRLDMDTTGLLLLTNDGQWNHRITSPRSHCPKCYIAIDSNPALENWPASAA